MIFIYIHLSPIRALSLVGIVMLFASSLHAQDANVKITIRLKNASLDQFVKTIEEQSVFSFIYGEEIHIKNKINMDVKDKPFTEVLKQVFRNEGIYFKIEGKHVLLRKETIQAAARKFTISGYVTDRVSSETLIGANVFENNQRLGTSTNPYGFYTLTLPEGETELHFSYLGYTSEKYSFSLHKDTLIQVKLYSNNLLEEVVVVSDRVEAGIQSTHTGAVDIPLLQIKNTPVLLGEADIMKTIQLLPGVQAGVDGSSGIHVRGGGTDQNLVLLDGVPLYNVDHLLGFFSVFTPEAVKKVTLFKSSFPARFGGRLSSVVDVRTNDGDMEKYHGLFSLGLLSSKFYFEGPILKKRTSFAVSFRRSYLDLVTRPFMKDDFKGGYNFYDLNAKVNHRFSDKHRLYLSVYNGNDAYNFKSVDQWISGEKDKEERNVAKDQTKIIWGNTIFSARWNYIVNNKLFSNTTVAYNRYKLYIDSRSYQGYREFERSYRSNYESGIRDFSYQIDFDYDPAPAHHIKFGTGYMYHHFRPEVSTSKISMKSEEEAKKETYGAIVNKPIHAHEFSLYAEDDLDLTTRLRANIGFHLSAFHVQGKKYISMQPRLSARYQLNRDLSMKVSYSKMNQYINLLTAAPISMPTDLWVPVTQKIRPMRADQYALGAYFVGFAGWEFSTEGYYKEMKNILEYKDATRFIGSSESWEEKVEMGNGRSFGVEFMARRTVGRTTGWLSYTLAKSDRKFSRNGINSGKRFPYKYDRRHTVNLIVNHKLSNKVDICASWNFATGGTTTIAHETTAIIRPDQYCLEYRNNPWIAASGYYKGNEILGTDYVESRNNYRLPSSHCLNFGINFNKKTRKGMRTWNITLYNVYNAMNPAFVYRKPKMIYDQEKDQYIDNSSLKKFTLLPFFPSVSYIYKF